MAKMAMLLAGIKCTKVQLLRQAIRGLRSNVLSLKYVDEFSPQSERQIVAHGVSRGSVAATLTPVPSPAPAGEGCRRRGEGRDPRAYALGYDISPLRGWASPPERRNDLFHGLRRRGSGAGML